MRYRQLGKTGLKVSVLGFGASPLGDVFSVTDPAEGVRAVHYVIDQGINFFDVSPYYGLTLAETRLGQALEGKRQEILLATKCGRYGANKFDFSAKTVVAGVDASLSRLKTDYVDLLQVHDVEFGNMDQIIKGLCLHFAISRRAVRRAPSGLPAIHSTRFSRLRRASKWTPS